MLKRLTLAILFGVGIYTLAFSTNFWEFRSHVGEVFNSPLEKEFFEEYRKTGRIKDLDTWLIMASGVYEQSKISFYRNQIDKLVLEVSNELKRKEISKYDTAKLIFDFLHQKVFKLYVERSTDIDQLLDTGHYNCVNSTALYNIILKKFGFEPKVIQLPDHIFSVFYIGTYKVEVETTARKGFDVVRNPEAVKELREKTSYVYVPEGRGTRIEIGDEGLIASVYANQVLNYKDTGNFTEILKSSIKALMLEPNLFLAYTNLRSAYIGLFTKLANEKKYQTSIQLAEESLKVFPKDKEIEEFIGGAYYNYVLTLIEEGNFEKSIEVIVAVSNERPRFYSNVLELIDYFVARWGRDEIANGNYENVLKVIEVGAKFDRKRAYSAGINLLVEVSRVFVNRREYNKPVLYHKWFVKMFPEGKEGKQNLGYYYNLWGIELMNAGDLVGAVKVFEESIADLPDDNILKQNCSIAYAKLSQTSFEKKDFENSVTFINRAIELFPTKQLDTIRKHIYIGWAKHLAFSEEDFKKAKEVCLRGLDIYPNEVELKRIYEYVSKK